MSADIGRQESIKRIVKCSDYKSVSYTVHIFYRKLERSAEECHSCGVITGHRKGSKFYVKNRSGSSVKPRASSKSKLNIIRINKDFNGAP